MPIGGGLDNGETPIEAASREVHEESSATMLDIFNEEPFLLEYIINGTKTQMYLVAGTVTPNTEFYPIDLAEDKLTVEHFSEPELSQLLTMGEIMRGDRTLRIQDALMSPTNGSINNMRQVTAEKIRQVHSFFRDNHQNYEAKLKSRILILLMKHQKIKRLTLDDRLKKINEVLRLSDNDVEKYFYAFLSDFEIQEFQLQQAFSQLRREQYSKRLHADGERKYEQPWERMMRLAMSLTRTEPTRDGTQDKISGKLEAQATSLDMIFFIKMVRDFCYAIDPSIKPKDSRLPYFSDMLADIKKTLSCESMPKQQKKIAEAYAKVVEKIFRKWFPKELDFWSRARLENNDESPNTDLVLGKLATWFEMRSFAQYAKIADSIIMDIAAQQLSPHTAYSSNFTEQLNEILSCDEPLQLLQYSICQDLPKNIQNASQEMRNRFVFEARRKLLFMMIIIQTDMVRETRIQAQSNGLLEREIWSKLLGEPVVRDYEQYRPFEGLDFEVVVDARSPKTLGSMARKVMARGESPLDIKDIYGRVIEVVPSKTKLYPRISRPIEYIAASGEKVRKNCSDFESVHEIIEKIMEICPGAKIHEFKPTPELGSGLASDGGGGGAPVSFAKFYLEIAGHIEEVMIFCPTEDGKSARDNKMFKQHDDKRYAIARLFSRSGKTFSSFVQIFFPSKIYGKPMSEVQKIMQQGHIFPQIPKS